ncbi:MAG: hemolysin family protein [Phycisphaerales bacterium]|jgi:CBS domain containing-hemolysin-like protein|nr:hemolysin family protein [Phycisphaerales bacterium]
MLAEVSNLGPGNIAILIFLLPLLVCSAFFSGSETALFRLGGAQRLELKHRNTSSSRAVLLLLDQPRGLLITILLGNMTVNVLYFVAGSVLLLRMPGGLLTDIAVAVGTLLTLTLFGEVIPKMAAATRPQGMALFLAQPLLLTHRAIGPLRALVDMLAVTPLSRLATTDSPTPLSAEELASLIDLSSSDGVIDRNEQEIIREVVELGQIRVREVMTPRVSMISIDADADEQTIREVVTATRLTQLPVQGGDLDHILGMLHVKRYLIRAAAGPTLLQASMTRPLFIPQNATLDQLLSHFRDKRCRLAIVVDEYGGTAGLVTLEDVLEELVGEIGMQTEEQASPPRRLDNDRWQLSGSTNVRTWADSAGLFLDRCPAATLGGLVLSKLGHIPEQGDVVHAGSLRLEVAEVAEHRVTSVIVSIDGGSP